MNNEQQVRQTKVENTTPAGQEAIKQGKDVLKTLIVFDYLPESTVYSIVSMTANEYNFFSKAHGYVLNVGYSENKDYIVNLISFATSEDKDAKKDAQEYIEERHSHYVNSWKQCKLEDVQDLSGIKKLIHSGFYL